MKQIRLTESDLKQIVKESVNRIVKESNELDANGWKDYIMRNSSYPRDIKDIENKASWEAFDDDVNSLYGQRGCYDDDYASQAYADDPLSDFYGLENKNTYDLKGYLAKKKLNKLAKNESKDMNKKLIRLTESDLHRIVKESVNKILNEVEFGGESLHGNNPEDWAAMKYLRTNRIDREGDAGMYDDDESGYFRNLRNWERNGKNQTDLMDKMYPNDYSNYFERGRALDAKGHNKANRISQKLGY